jgi:hypothetical protein
MHARRNILANMDIRVAIIVDPTLPLGLLANTVAALGIGIGAAEEQLGRTLLTDLRGRTVTTSSNRPVPILQAEPPVIGALLLRALAAPDAGIVVPFPRFARAVHDFAAYTAEFPLHDLETTAIDGLGLAGPQKWVRSLTGSLKLLR